ncbi:hypothetical protein AB0F17_49470 [Nonomuraea sp. NPDC026600]|uniref:hypothetical protein n=1 Tax=Nonomuraea sp. NPDC026600 TaxID=3155363 RepID=UPI003401E7B9
MKIGLARGLMASSGWKVQWKSRSPSLGSTSTASTERSLWINALIFRLPAAVVMVPVSSAFHRSSRQSTPVIAPTGSSVRWPMGRRARPNSAPYSGRWSWTSLCCTLKRTALASCCA